MLELGDMAALMKLIYLPAISLSTLWVWDDVAGWVGSEVSWRVGDVTDWEACGSGEWMAEISTEVSGS